MTTHMAAIYAIGRIMQRLKNLIKDEDTEKKVEKVIEEELNGVFSDFLDIHAFDDFLSCDDCYLGSIIAVAK